MKRRTLATVLTWQLAYAVVIARRCERRGPTYVLPRHDKGEDRN
jgi:hypothetical protein